MTGADLDAEALRLLQAGRADEALATTVRALEVGGGAASRQLFVETIGRVGVASLAIRPWVARALREGWARPEVLGGIALTQLRAAWPNSAQAIANDELLAELLVSTPVRDPEIERRLCAVRKGVVSARGEPLLPLMARLATQCHLTEYAWREDAEEAALADRLAAAIAAGTESAADLLALACYRPLDGVEGIDGLLDRDWPVPVTRVLALQVAAPRAVRAAAEAVEVLTPIGDGVSVAVRAQYEANPYPRWMRLSQPTAMTIDGLLAALFPHARLDPIPNAASPRILVAGCGTGQEAILAAQRHPTAQVLGVDLSRASLGYAATKTAEAGLGNVRFAQADILALGDQRFDIVTASGVLHHMADPFAGARVLAELLPTGGVMKIGLYSAAARRLLDPAKALAQDYPPTAEGIRALRAAILGAAPGDPVRGVLGIADFYSLSGCRDLLMHAQEHQMTLADIARMMDECGLRLLGFALGGRETAAYRQAYPQDPAGLDLDNWAAFETAYPTTFIGMYQFWAQKAG